MISQINKESQMVISSYSVPAIPVVTWLSSEATHRISPKSPIFGIRFSSRRTLLVFMSLWMIFTSQPPWRCARPSAVPQMISNLCFQLRILFEFLTAVNRSCISIANIQLKFVKWNRHFTTRSHRDFMTRPHWDQYKPCPLCYFKVQSMRLYTGHMLSELI